MKIIVRKSDGVVVMAADSPSSGFSAEEYDIHDLPGWDWSLANTSGTNPAYPVLDQLMWNGTTLVRNPDWTPPPLPDPIV